MESAWAAYSYSYRDLAKIRAVIITEKVSMLVKRVCTYRNGRRPPPPPQYYNRLRFIVYTRNVSRSALTPFIASYRRRTGSEALGRKVSRVRRRPAVSHWHSAAQSVVQSANATARADRLRGHARQLSHDQQWTFGYEFYYLKPFQSMDTSSLLLLFLN